MGKVFDEERKLYIVCIRYDRLYFDVSECVRLMDDAGERKGNE